MSTSTITTPSSALTIPQFPTLTTTQDSKYYSVEQEDVSLQTKMDGGYVVSRAKTTRPARRTFTTGFTAISNEDMQTLQAFYDSCMGGSTIFTWQDPIQKLTWQVRFMDKKLNFKYTGVGVANLWDVQFTLTSA